MGRRWRRWRGLGLRRRRLLGACLGEEGVGQLLLQRQGIHGHSLGEEEGVSGEATRQEGPGWEYLVPGNTPCLTCSPKMSQVNKGTSRAWTGKAQAERGQALPRVTEG